MSGDSLGDRMKGYENIPRIQLIPKLPVMMRLDGKAFHTFTRGMERPYCRHFHECMWAAAKHLCENIQGCQIAYVQSDEITLLLTDTEMLQTQGWYGYGLQKMVSTAAAMCSLAFYREYLGRFRFHENDVVVDNEEVRMTLSSSPLPSFDARAWNLPRHEVVNAFIWRQQDATRNDIQLLGQHYYSHKQLHGVNCNQIQDMVFKDHGINFNDLPVPQRRGVCCVRTAKETETPVKRFLWTVDENIPIFTADRNYIEKYVNEEGL